MELEASDLHNPKSGSVLGDHNDTAGVAEMCNHRLLTAEEEIELAKRIQAGDEEALHELVRCNVRLVASAAKAHVYKIRYGYADAISNGLIGLMVAAKKFDPERKLRFSTLARWEIKRAMQQGQITSVSPAVNVPLGALALYYKYVNGEDIPDSRMRTVKYVQQAVEGSTGEKGIDGEFTPHYDEAPYPEHMLELFRKSFAMLCEKDQEILAKRWGLAPYETPISYEEIAEQEGIKLKSARSREKVARRRLELIMRNYSSKFQLEVSN